MKKWIVFSIITVSLLYYYFSSPSQQEPVAHLQEKDSRSVDHSTNKKNIDKDQQKLNQPNSLTVTTKPTQKSVLDMTEQEGQEAAQHVFREALLPEATIESFVTNLKAYGSEPLINREGDEDFGYVYSISLESAFPGTRNFSAYYEGTPGGTPALRRISFEFPPDTNSVDQAKTFLSSLPGITRVVEDGEDFSRTQYEDGHHGWHKKMDQEWISQPNPDYAYSKEDIGTVLVVREFDIHPDIHSHAEPLDNLNDQNLDGNEDHDHDHDHDH